MRLRQTGQTEKWRVAVFVAVLALHVLAGWLLFATRSLRIARLRAADTPLSLLWLSQESPARVSLSSAAPSPDRNLKRREASPSIETPPSVSQPEPSNAITLSFDLSADADAAARRQLDKEENERRWRNLAGPSDSQLEWSRHNAPLTRGYHQFGDDEHAEGGELITWVNDRCYYTTHGPTTFGMPFTSKVCKDPPKPETDLFKDMRKRLDESAKGPNP
jgi:hypothetical protein